MRDATTQDDRALRLTLVVVILLAIVGGLFSLWHASREPVLVPMTVDERQWRELAELREALQITDGKVEVLRRRADLLEAQAHTHVDIPAVKPVDDDLTACGTRSTDGPCGIGPEVARRRHP